MPVEEVIYDAVLRASTYICSYKSGSLALDHFLTCLNIWASHLLCLCFGIIALLQRCVLWINEPLFVSLVSIYLRKGLSVLIVTKGKDTDNNNNDNISVLNLRNAIVLRSFECFSGRIYHFKKLLLQTCRKNRLTSLSAELSKKIKYNPFISSHSYYSLSITKGNHIIV